MCVKKGAAILMRGMPLTTALPLTMRSDDKTVSHEQQPL